MECRPVIILTSCDEKLAQEKRGSFGFHHYNECPNCIKTKRGYALWGENGFWQGDIGFEPTNEYIKELEVS